MISSDIKQRLLGATILIAMCFSSGAISGYYFSRAGYIPITSHSSETKGLKGKVIGRKEKVLSSLTDNNLPYSEAHLAVLPSFYSPSSPSHPLHPLNPSNPNSPTNQMIRGAARQNKKAQEKTEYITKVVYSYKGQEFILSWNNQEVYNQTKEGGSVDILIKDVFETRRKSGMLETRMTDEHKVIEVRPTK